MAGDTSLQHLSRERVADIILKKILLDCDSKEGLKYTISGAVYNSEVTNVSKAAYNLLKEKYSKNLHSNYFLLKDTHKDFRVEHVIPVEFLYQFFMSKKQEGTLSKQLILDTLDEAAIAIITLEEDKALNKAGLRKQMPSSFEIFKHDPFNRYKQAGILMHRWPSNFSSHHDKV